MMPGDSQSKTVAIAADATVGNCQNCSVLHQSLNEYVSSFLALKQKITGSDDAIRLQHQTKELQMKLVTLEKKTADYESLQKELEQKKDALKAFGQISEELGKLKQENIKTSTENMKLGDELKTAKELIKTQSLENAQLMREKVEVENDLLQSQMSLKKSQAQADQVEQLMKENAQTAIINKTLEDELKTLKEIVETQSLESARLKREKAEVENDLLEIQTSLKKSKVQADQVEQLMKDNAESTIMKNNLENKVGLLEESVFKQNHTIRELNKEKFLLERNIHDLQVRLIKLEKERNKEYRSTSTQASVPEEPKVDKEKFRLLLENLWACVEPQQQMENLHLTEPTSKQILPSSPQYKLHHHQRNRTQSTPDRTESHQSCPIQTNHNTITQLKRSQCFMQKASSHQESQNCTKSNMEIDISKPDEQPSQTHETEESSACSPKISVEEIVELFKPMLPCLSPLLDTETEMESMETEDEDEDSISKTADQVSRYCPKSSALQTEGTVDLTVVNTHEIEDNSKENYLKQKDVEDKRQIMGGKKMHPQTKEPEAISESSSSSTLDKTVSVEAASLPAKNKEPRSSVMVDSSGANIEMPRCNIEDTGKALGPTEPGTWDSKSEILEKMDVDMGADDVTGMADEESPTEGYPTVVSGETSEPRPVTSLTFTSAVQDDKDTNNEKDGTTNCNTSGMGLDCQNITGLQSQMSTEFPREDTEQPQDNACLSEAAVSSSIPSVADQNLKQRVENNFAIKLSGKKSENEAEGTGRTDVTASLSLSKHISRPPSPCKSPLLKMEIAGETRVNQESGNANGVSVKTKEENRNRKSEIAAGSSPVLCDVQLTQTVNCTPVQEPSHSVCRQKSPSCLVPTIKLHTLENDTNSENDNIDSEHLSANKAILHPTCTEEEENVGNALVKLFQEAESCVGPTVSVSVPVEQSVVQTNGQNKCSESFRETSAQQKSPVATTVQLSEFIGQARCEMGPPLPRLLTPLSTPPKLGKQINPRQAIGKLSFPSPMDRSGSPTTPVQAPTTPNNHQVGSSSLNSPLPPNGVPSSPLQFGSATPKHAVPVPGRLPVTAMNSSSSSSSSSSPSQENSMRILDTMYPELSARARTLNILRGNVNLSICSSDSGTLPATAENPISSFKSINSASTAFTKTETRGGKRHAISPPQPKNNKCLRLDHRSPSQSPQRLPSSSSDDDETTSKQTPSEMTSPSMDGGQSAESKIIVQSLQKIEQGCFDLLPVIQSHLYVGNMPKKPVLRDEEKEVISEICQRSSPIADEMILAILNKLKDDNRVLSRHYMEALCRVYTGICRQKSDWEKAHILAYSILTEDFPDSARLILFMVTTWPSVLAHTSLLCQAIHTVTKLKTPKELLSCISAYIGWDKTPPCDIDQLISRAMSEIQSRKQLSFTKHSRCGHDLSTEAWEQVFTLHLLCGYKKWKWTYENVLGKQLWPLMNTWVTQPRDEQTHVLDMTVATIIRLIGRLAQLGIKERCVSSVMTVANVMNTFGRHGQSEGVPWEVQLAAVYCIYDLSPCNPKQALDALAGWREDTSGSVPPAVTSCINQLASICRQVKS
ncbi:little elongation complex subunit 1 isoform X2 [Sphaeramia orbicularis]|uniref:little elongation complex subunit 1 isoform X2 n=1 Tax=Sphaeramia orbicularis TaxID=375764 RepID=UPI00117D1112|nr:little elongation complex subunit 1 isoform X2 [Sphaeramia orbicularis]